MNTLGIDIGGTKIFVGRYNQNLELEAQCTLPTLADKTAKHTLANLIKAIEEVKNTDTTSLGVAWAGFVNPQNGSIIKAPNIPSLDGFALCRFLTEHTNLPAIIENDARAFAYGARAKIAPESKMCLGIIIGTGVGSGLIYNGQLIYGAHGYAGEIGHMTRQNKELETWLAGPDLKKFLELKDSTQFSDLLPEHQETTLQKIEQPLNIFASWLAGLVLTFDPDHIIMGGGTAQYFWQHYETEIITRTQNQLKNYPNKFKLHFYNNNNAGAAGAAALCRVQ